VKIAIESLRFVEVADTDAYKNAFVIEHSEVKADSVFFVAQDKNEKVSWKKELKTTLDEYRKKKISDLAKGKLKAKS